MIVEKRVTEDIEAHKDHKDSKVKRGVLENVDQEVLEEMMELKEKEENLGSVDLWENVGQ